jgi:hypothetical protein
MGLEAACTLRVGRKSWPGRAHLESDSLRFRGEETRVVIPLRGVSAVEARGGTLTVMHAGGRAAFIMGPAAERWAEKIRNPRSLLDKLGVKPGMQVAVIDVDDEEFLADLAARAGTVSRGKAAKHTDLIFFGAESARALQRLGTLRTALVPNGAIWVVHRKGKDASIRDVDVFAAAKTAGLVDIKVASFSATHTAEKLVIPVVSRGVSRG